MMEGLENIKKMRWLKGDAKREWDAKALAEKLGVKTLTVTRGSIEVGKDPGGNPIFKEGICIELIGEPDAAALAEIDAEFLAQGLEKEEKKL